MYIKFKEVEIEGFLSVGEPQIVTLSDRGLMFIRGINKYDLLSPSNGSGKSTIFESIIWCLAKTTTRGLKDVANRYWRDYCRVRTAFDIDDISYEVTRYKNHPDHGNYLSIVKDGKDISANTETKSNEILSKEIPFLNYDILTSIILLSQGLPNKLSSHGPSGRKNRLEELSLTNQYIKEVQDKLSSSVDKLSGKLSVANNKVTQYSTEIRMLENNIESNKATIKSMQDKSKSSISKEEYDKATNELKIIKEKINNVDTLLRTAEQSLSTAQFSVEMIDNKINTLSTEIQTLNKQYLSFSEAKCHTCGQVISDKNTLDQLKLETMNQILKKKNELAELFKNKDSASYNVQQYTNEKTNLSTTVEELKIGVSTRETIINSYSSEDLSILTVLEDSITDDQNSLKVSNDNKITAMDDVSKIRKDLEKGQYLQSQSSRHFRNYLLKGVVDYMNHKMDGYSSILFSNPSDKVRLEIDGNNLNLLLGNAPYEGLSGGEGRRVDLIIQLAQRDLAMNEAGLASNLLSLDEVLDYLDETGVQQVLGLFTTKSEEVDTICIISHKNNLAIPYDSEIVCIKGSDRITRISTLR